MKRLLVVLEQSGGAAQDQVRGPIYWQLFVTSGIEVEYMGRRPRPPVSIAAGKTRLATEIGKTVPYRVGWRLTEAMASAVNERRILAKAAHFDAIHLIKVASPGFVKRLRFAAPHARLIYDLGDALWMPAYASRYRQLSEILSTVDAVTCDNRYGLEYARQFNEQTYVCIPPSQVEFFDQYRGAARKGQNNEVVVGWIGSPSTLFHLYAAWEALEAVNARHRRMRLRIVGGGTDPHLLPNFENVRWSVRPYYDREAMAREVLGFDIGIFPMFDVLDAKTRGILKALLYMSGEAAVVGSPRGELVELVEDGANGHLADSRSEWVEALDRLIASAAERHRLAEAGLQTVRTRYSLEASFRTLLAAVRGETP